MAETSRSKFTITLGRGGQVVKRAGFVSDGVAFDSVQAVGSKRSVRDRLGSNVGDSLVDGRQFNNKRLREDSDRANLNTNNFNDLHVSKDDLRFKLMQKNMFRIAQNDDQNNMDLRKKLSRTTRPSVSFSDAQQRIPERQDISFLGQIAPMKSVNASPSMNTFRNPYSVQSSTQLRQTTSPGRIFGTSRDISPPRNAELQRRALVRPLDDVRSFPYTSRDVDHLRHVHAASYIAKSDLHTRLVKPVAPLAAQLPPQDSFVLKSSGMGDEQPTVDSLLHSLGLGKYAILFKAEEVDMAALKQMGDSDLKELGIPMGPRKKILLAVLPRSRHRS